MVPNFSSSTVNKKPELIGGRYRLLDQLGKGGMGSVYRAFDRLTGNEVALKRVLGGDDLLMTTSSSDSAPDFRLSLTREFQSLASLRHPNIIGVIDYGFDNDRQPYFTMDVVEDAQNVLETGEDQHLNNKVGLLVQILQALAYIHRRQIVHRDLKPGNVLVTEAHFEALGNGDPVKQVKVLDFGLSVDIEEATGTVGTLFYMAPEVLRGTQAGPPADLYAVGVLAYNLFAGHNPFEDPDTVSVFDRILNVVPDCSQLDAPKSVRDVIQRLLAKDVSVRYAEAKEVIDDLSAAIEQPVPIETEAMRESFLQAARFVSRERELGQLLDALLNAEKAAVGSAWLVAGESGVGKSRLMDEVRIRSLVRGAAVIQGQAVSDGGRLYDVWRRGLRQLALSANITDQQAGILKPVIPDIDRLLEREIADAPELDSQAAQQRLMNTVVEMVTAVIQTQGNPLVILLEDLQWAGAESLNLLKSLNQHTPDLPLLIIGNYRDDEQPDLPHYLPGMSVIKLKRLDSSAITELSESMLGAAGKQADVLTLLNRETEGNPFFLVEVVRALAEEAGQLDKIGSTTLPAHVFTGGLQRLVQRRLNRVPQRHWPLLQLSAVAGREIDLRILQALNWKGANLDLETWLTDCVNAAVLEKQGDQWRFAHDKLREGFFTDISPSSLSKMHKSIAQAIEIAYIPNESEAARLSYHWMQAGNLPKAAHYTILAGDQAMRIGANAEAKNFFEQAIDTLARLSPTTENRQRLIDITLKLSRVAAFSPSENMQQLLEQALETAAALEDEIRLAYVYSSLGAFHYIGTRMRQAFENFSQGVTLAEKLGLEQLLVLPYNLMGRALCNMGQYGNSADMLAKGIPLAEKFADKELLAGSLAFHAATLYYQGRWAEAEIQASRSIAEAEALGHPSRMAGNLMVLGFVLGFCGHFDQAIDYLEQSIEIASQDEALALHILNLSHGCLGYIHLQREQYDTATRHLDRCLALAQGKEQLLAHLPMYEGFRAEITLQNGQRAKALAQAEAALLRAEQTEQPMAKAHVQQSMSRILAADDSPDWERIQGLLKESNEFHENGPAVPLAAISKFELGKVYAQQGLKEQSQKMFIQALHQFETLRMTWHIGLAKEVIT